MAVLCERCEDVTRTSYFFTCGISSRALQQIVKDGFRSYIIHVQIYDAGAPAVLSGKIIHIPVVISEHFSSFARTSLGQLDLFKAWVAFRWADIVLPAGASLHKAVETYGIRARFQVVRNVTDNSLFSHPFPPPRKSGVQAHPIRRTVDAGERCPIPPPRSVPARSEAR
jgi:hypothetical protein